MITNTRLNHIYLTAEILLIAVLNVFLISLILKETGSLLLHLTVSTAVIIAAQYIINNILYFGRRKYTDQMHFNTRIILSSFFVVMLTMALTYLYIIVVNVFETLSWNRQSIAALQVFSLVSCFNYVRIQELTYSGRKREQLVKEIIQVSKENLQTRFDSLKNQVNPHFLFNSLNSLRSLIEDDTVKAEMFVLKLSNVYRYLLQENDKELTSLCSELNFIKSYFYILKTRFNWGLMEEINVPEKFGDYQIPPLTLQLLVENAVKHNVISQMRPLTINIHVNESKELVVTNNLQRKTQAMLSTGFGLENITVKYRLLNKGEVTVNETENYFEVRLPLIDKDYYITSKTFQLKN